MKILLMSSSSGSRGGGEIYLRTLAHSLMISGAQVVVAMSTHPQMDELAADCTALELDVRRFDYLNTYHRRFRSLAAWFDSAQAKRVKVAIQKVRPDLVHLNLQTVEDGLDLLQGASQCAIPAVATVHQTFGMHRLQATAGRVRDWIARRCFHTAGIPSIAVSHASGINLAGFLSSTLRTSDHAEENSEIVGLTTYVVPNGVVAPNVLPTNLVRMAWGIPEGAVVLGCLARIEYEKNPLFLVDLLQNLPINTHIVWIGDGRLRVPLQKAIDATQMTHRFHVTGWEKNATRLLSGIDVFLLPSLYEGLSLALLEAMSTGLPCVVSDVDGTRDAIQSGVSGYLCPVGDVDYWSRILNPLIQSTELRETIGQAARTRYEEMFSLETMTKRTIGVYERTIDSFQRSSAGKSDSRQP